MIIAPPPITPYDPAVLTPPTIANITLPTACPQSQTQGTCNGKGTCVAPASVSNQGVCECTEGYSGLACTKLPPHPVANCSLPGRTSSQFLFDNRAANTLALSVCPDSTSCDHKYPCNANVPPHTTVILVVPLFTSQVYATFCVEGSQASGCTTYSESFTFDPKLLRWRPPLETPASNATFCSVDSECVGKVRLRVGVGVGLGVCLAVAS